MGRATWSSAPERAITRSAAAGPTAKEIGMKTMVRSLTLLALAALLGQAFALDARAGTLYVGNNGEDLPGCGSSADPCRSIGAAIRAASDGDRIVVGPGRYGDL